VKGALLIEYIQQAIETQGITREEFARRAGMSRAGFYKLLDKLSGKEIGELRLSTLIRLARGLDMSYLALIHQLTGGSLGGACARKSPFVAGDALRLVEGAMNNMSDVRSGEEFVRLWTLQNAGVSAWSQRRLVCLDGYICAMRQGTRCGTPLVFPELLALDEEIAIQPTAPGEKATVSVRFRARIDTGVATSYWKMVNLEGEYCFPGLADVICTVRVLEH